MGWSSQYKRVCLILLLSSLYIFSWNSIEARLFSNDHHTGQVSEASPTKKEKSKVFEEGNDMNYVVYVNEYRGLGHLGSSPPSCEHKCGGCRPCAAIQVPTNSGRLQTQYANYEPEGWKCKCGSAVYNP